MSKKKYSHFSTDQLKEVQELKGKKLILSTIKPGDLFVKFTALCDIKGVFFGDQNPLHVSIVQTNDIFDVLLSKQFFESLENTRSNSVVLYKCLKQWNSNSLKP